MNEELMMNENEELEVEEEQEQFDSGSNPFGTFLGGALAGGAALYGINKVYRWAKKKTKDKRHEKWAKEMEADGWCCEAPEPEKEPVDVEVEEEVIDNKKKK